MGNLDTFKIDLKGLSTENACFEFSLDKAYFDAIGSEDLKGGDLHTTLQVRKVAGNFELSFHTEGVVTVACDLCLDDMSLPIATDNKLVARLGDEFDDSDEYIVIPADEGILDVAWLIYEFVALALPMRHVHEEGQCNPDMIRRIEQLVVDSSDDDEAVDPRWNELKKLKSTIKE